MLPNFLVIGAMKAGTGSLYEYLRHHPKVFMSDPKELDFFVQELNWGRGEAWYKQHFDASRSVVAIGEASTSYSKHPLYPGVAERISRMLPDIRLVYLVRHPIDRLCSQYLHQRLHGWEHRPIEQAVLEDSTYLDFSRYAFQIERYLDHFSSDQMLLVKSEDLRDRREATIDRVLTFIGVNGLPPTEVLGQEFHQTAEKRALRPLFERLHHFPGHQTVARLVPDSVKERTFRLRTRGIDPSRARLSDQVRSTLEAQLRDDVGCLRAFMGNDFDGWGIG